MKPKDLPGLLLIRAFLLLLGSGVRNRIRFLSVEEELALVHRENRRLVTHKQALLHVLNQRALKPPVLEAEVVVGSPRGIQFPNPTHLVLYALSTDCPICPKNYPFLDSLAGLGYPVLGLATDSAEASVRDHVLETGIVFPILVNAHGSLLDRIPKLVVPTLITVRNGEIGFLEFGELGSEAKEVLRSDLREWEGFHNLDGIVRIQGSPVTSQPYIALRRRNRLVPWLVCVVDASSWGVQRSLSPALVHGSRCDGILTVPGPVPGATADEVSQAQPVQAHTKSRHRAVFRYKSILGQRMRSRSLSAPNRSRSVSPARS